MPPFRTMPILLATIPWLSGCVSAGSAPIIVPDRTASRPAPTQQQQPVAQSAATRPSASQNTPQVQSGPGLESVIGASAAQLQRQFGNPRLDVSEGDARKLQFAGTACILDVFLYPDRPGADPTAAHVEARRASDGRNVDRAACVRALRRR